MAQTSRWGMGPLATSCRWWLTRTVGVDQRGHSMSSASEPPESPTEPMAGAQLHGRLVWGMAMLFVIIMATVTFAIISAGEGTGGAPLVVRLILIAVVIPAA